LRRAADGFIGWSISPRYNRIEVIFNFNAVFIFKFLNLYAQPASNVRAYDPGKRRCHEAKCSLDFSLMMSIFTYTAK
jgi:hypothetical protein